MGLLCWLHDWLIPRPVGRTAHLQPFPCHRLVLAARCSYFRDMFKNAGTKKLKSELQVNNFAPCVVQSLVDYLHKDKLDLSNIGDSIELIRIAKEFDFGALQTAASTLVASNLAVDNVVK